MHIGALIAGLGIVVQTAHDQARSVAVRVCDITEDSRTVLPGSLFIARRGVQSDGRAFVPMAIKAGACAILSDDPDLVLPEPVREQELPVLLYAADINLATAQLAERFYGEPSRAMHVIGVTGTNGKTTTTFLIHQMLNQLGVRCGLIGTVVIDDGTEVSPSSLTTPPALEVSRTLSRMLEAGCKAAVMETSSHALHQKRVGALTFAAGVFTNLTHDHLDYHGTMENYAAAKAGLFEMLGRDGRAIVNAQDSWTVRMLRDCRAAIAGCGIRPETPGAPDQVGDREGSSGGYWARVIGADTSGTNVELEYGGKQYEARIPLVGGFNVMNALQALATVHQVFGSFGMEQVIAALQQVNPPPGRLEPVTVDGDAIQVFVDYAHTDDALQTVLRTVRGALRQRGESGGEGRLWCVFGCGGDRDRTKRPKMGRIAHEMADCVVVTSDNPRTEQPDAIVEEILAGMQGEGRGGNRVQAGRAQDWAQARVRVELDRERAIQLAIRNLEPGDALIIAGKGHEDYQILPDPAMPGKTITRHFDDREVARAALEARGIVVRRPLVRAAEPDPNGGSLV